MIAKIRTLVMIVVAGSLVVFIAWQFLLPRLIPHTFYGQVIQGGSPTPAIELDGPGGEVVALSDFEGEVVVLYFGYTFCPDVCPITLSKLARAKRIMGEKGDDVQVIMISVDPVRDTSEILSEYVAHFDETFIGLTGDVDDIGRVATVYGVFFEAEESTSSSGYLVTHSSSLMVIDMSGELKLIIPYGATDKEVASDLSYLVG